MADVAAAKRYAQATFDLALERGDSLSTWRSDLNDIATVLAESDASAWLADTRVPTEQRLGLVERALDIQPMAVNLAKLLVAKGRAPDARAVERAFGQLADEAEGVAQATVTAAVELRPEQIQTLEGRLSDAVGRRVTATANVDPSIMGGIIVRIGDRLVDGSVRSRLARLKRELSGAG